LLARYLARVSDERTFHETRVALFVQLANMAAMDARAAAYKLTGAELAELRRIVHLGCCHVPDQAMAQRLADFKLVRAAADVVTHSAWVAEPWGKFVIQEGRFVAEATKEGAQ
jgi:hypothetical protein